MEEILNTKVSELLVQGVWFVVAAVGGAGAAMLSMLIFGRGYKKRIAALEARVSMLP